eukprot:3620286-Amphidinium_carterae.3
MEQIGFPIREWIKQNPTSVYVPLNQKFHTAVGNFPPINIENTRGATNQELRALPEDVDRHFSELAKAHPISMKAVRNTVNDEKEKWKESMKKELKRLLYRDTYDS